MAQDLRDLFKKEQCEEGFAMTKGHEQRFEQLLEKELPQKRKNPFFFVKIAAAILVLIGSGLFFYMHRDNTGITTTIVTENPDKDTKTGISLGDLSPDLKKVENYYVANINLELSKLDVSGDTKDMVESYMERLSELNAEYKNLNFELNQIGPNDQTISALIKNLQLRLQLLQQLKSKLNEIQSSKNEQYETNAI
ncbi:hypothetical protein HPE56_15375 [Maribacter sp. ANRC-HE7]|uniref:Uncharacterized protein n=1 Tax=Maribacter aquimaris TaxID=2737171 RepID=A0ABR7V5E6_9FLAO|nr:hypothetical protein [Maribacter aquimaris]MBD0779180.1 hypothetical protein [Maribacter aquimaris]